MAYDELIYIYMKVLLETLLRRPARVKTADFVHVRETFIVEIDEFGFPIFI